MQKFVSGSGSVLGRTGTGNEPNIQLRFDFGSEPNCDNPTLLPVLITPGLGGIIIKAMYNLYI